jgi:primosomal protein N' (replication factor Y)
MAILQTYFPDNNIIKALQTREKNKFYEYEMQMRQHSNMPPFSRLAAIILSGSNLEKTKLVAKELVKIAPIHQEILVLGPIESSIFRIKRKYRYRILIKSAKNVDIQKYIEFWLNKINIPSSIHLKIDIDPYNFT